MLWTIFVILLVLWLLGLVTSYTLGGFIHILLVLAVVVLVINLVQGRRVCLVEVNKHETDDLDWDFVNRSGRTGPRLSRHQLHTSRKMSSMWDRCMSLRKLTSEFPFLQYSEGWHWLEGSCWWLWERGVSHSSDYESGL